MGGGVHFLKRPDQQQTARCVPGVAATCRTGGMNISFLPMCAFLAHATHAQHQHHKCWCSVHTTLPMFRFHLTSCCCFCCFCCCSFITGLLHTSCCHLTSCCCCCCSVQQVCGVLHCSNLPDFRVSDHVERDGLEDFVEALAALAHEEALQQ